MALVHVEEDKLIRIGGPQVVDCLGTVGECILKDAATKVQGVAFDKMLEYGSPADVIIKVAKKADVDIIVVGSRGLSSVRRYLLGSVSDDVSMHARSSVLIVRRVKKIIGGSAISIFLQQVKLLLVFTCARG